MTTINEFVDRVFCVNLKARKDKKKWISRQFNKYSIKASFFDAVANKKRPAVGCLQSHLRIIKMAKKQGLKRVLITEDDCLFTEKPLIDESSLPEDWQMLFLGGNVQGVMEDTTKSLSDKKWVKMHCMTTHCYIVNDTAYDRIIEELSVYKQPVDVYYDKVFHQLGTSYIANPQMATQKDGYSDIEKKKLRYNMQDIDDFVEIDDVEHSIDSEDNYTMKMGNWTDEDLPYVSILTVTKNRKKLFPMAIYNWNNFDYPAEKLQWVILDDSDKPGNNLSDILPVDKRIKYVRISSKQKIPVSAKRNLIMKHADHDILVNMDDDDFYMPSSVKTRVKVLLQYPEKDIVGCGMICCYDVHQDGFYVLGNKCQYAEASMAFRRRFMEEREFNEQIRLGEGILFMRNRKDKGVRIPWSFVMFAMNHKHNMTGSIRKADKSHFIDMFDLPTEVMDILREIHRVKN